MSSKQLREQAAKDRAADSASTLIAKLLVIKIETESSLKEHADNEQGQACFHIDDAIVALRRAIHFILLDE